MSSKDFFSKNAKKVPDNIPAMVGPSFSSGFIRGVIAGTMLLAILVHIGFSKTYIRFFPGFDGFSTAQHFHGVMMMTWLLMLLVQPILILKGKTKLHRNIGKLSYVLAPLVILSMYFIINSRYHIYLARGGQTANVIAWLSLNFRLMMFFVVLYLLAIYYKHKPALHARFMCSTGFLLIGPGLVRLLITYPAFSHADSHSIDRYGNIMIAGIVTIIDSWRTRRLSPFVLVLSFMVLQKILWDLRDAPLWQAAGRLISHLF